MPIDYSLAEQEMKRIGLLRKNALSIGGLRGGAIGGVPEQHYDRVRPKDLCEVLSVHHNNIW